MNKKPHPRSCINCRRLGQEDDGNYAEFMRSWTSCDIEDRYQYLKSFPFKKRMPCFRNHIKVDGYKLYDPDCELYSGGIWTETDFERLFKLESNGEMYR